MAYRDLILNNFWLKGFSAVLATLIWLALRQSDMPTDAPPQNPFSRSKELNVTRAVSVLKSPTEQRLFRIDPAQVTVTVGGEANMLNQLNPEDVHVYVNVGAVKDPQGALRVEVHVPPRVSIYAITPASVDVRPIVSNP